MKAKLDNKSFGAEYEKVEKIRNDLGELKKVMVCPTDLLVLFTFHKTVVVSSVDTILSLRAANKAIDIEVTKRDKVLTDLAGYTSIFGEGSEFGMSLAATPTDCSNRQKSCYRRNHKGSSTTGHEQRTAI